MSIEVSLLSIVMTFFAKHAQQNAGALGWRLTDEEVAQLDEMSDEVLKP
ncbi:MAG: hypothetical protein HY869_08355 [Chloroflexi bacterium]|nr:hypothetical protein [Chloroflexota bacterium]